jgi:hypothetical protein
VPNSSKLPDLDQELALKSRLQFEDYANHRKHLIFFSLGQDVWGERL